MLSFRSSNESYKICVIQRLATIASEYISPVIHWFIFVKLMKVIQGILKLFYRNTHLASIYNNIWQLQRK